MRAGVFQCAGGGLQPQQRLERLSEAITSQAVDLVVCPELFMSGYNVGSVISQIAEPSNGPFAQQMRALAKRSKTALIYGYAERVGDQLYNSALCFNADGEVVANHRKMLLPPGFEAGSFAQGSGLTLFDLAGIRCAILICYDAEFPESVRAVAEAGAQLVIVPTALTDNWATVARQLMPTRAFENGVWLIYANHAGFEGDLNYLGESCIVAPDGSDAARAGSDQQMISAQIDLKRVVKAQARLPYLQDVKRLRLQLD